MGVGRHDPAQRVPPRQLLAVMDVRRRCGAGRVLVPSVVTLVAVNLLHAR